MTSLIIGQVSAQLHDFNTKDINPLTLFKQARLKKISTQKIGKILSINGKVKIDGRAIVNVGQDLFIGSTIETLEGYISILVAGNHLIDIDANSRLHIVSLGDDEITKDTLDVGAILDRGKLRAIKGSNENNSIVRSFPIITEGGTLVLDSGQYLVEVLNENALLRKVKFLSIDSNTELNLKSTSEREIKDDSPDRLNYNSMSKIFFSNVDVDGGEGVIGAGDANEIEVQYFPDVAKQNNSAILSPVTSLNSFKKDYMSKIEWNSILAKTGLGERNIMAPVIVVHNPDENKKLEEELDAPRKPESSFGLPGANVDETNQSYNLTIRVEL